MKTRTIMGIAIFAAAQPLAAQIPPTPSLASVPAKAERMICKRSAPAGSLIETRRECHTREEWSRIAQAGRADGQNIVDRAAVRGQ